MCPFVPSFGLGSGFVAQFWLSGTGVCMSSSQSLLPLPHGSHAVAGSWKNGRGHADTESHTVSITPSRQFAHPFFFTPALLFGRSWAKQRTPWQRKINTENSPPTSGRSVCGSRSELVELVVVLVPHTYLLSTYPTTKCPHIRAHCYTTSHACSLSQKEKDEVSGRCIDVSLKTMDGRLS